MPTTAADEPATVAPPAMKQILEMVRAGTLTDEQAAALLAEIGGSGAATPARESAGETGAGRPVDMGSLLSNSIGRLFAGDALHNRMKGSNVESPEGVDYVFKDNEIVMSNLRGILLRRASFERNRLTASNVKEILVEDGALADGSLKMSNLKEVSIRSSSARGLALTASNIRELVMKNRSLLEGIELRASSIREWTLDEGSVEALDLKESSMKDVSVSKSSWRRSSVQFASMADLRLSGADLHETQFLACELRDFLIEDSQIRSSLFHSLPAKDMAFRGCRFDDVHLITGDGWRRQKYESVAFEACQFKRVLFSNCRFEKVVFSNITAENVQLEGVVLKNQRIDGNEAFLRLASARAESANEGAGAKKG